MGGLIANLELVCITQIFATSWFFSLHKIPFVAERNFNVEIYLRFNEIYLIFYP